VAENTAIEWCDATFNPWIGCTKVGPGCDHCYAERREDKRLHRVQWGPGQPRQRTKTWGDPKRWNAQHDAFLGEHGRRQRVFCASLADVFDNDVPTLWRVELLTLIGACDQLDWLLLTKRVGNVKRLLCEAAELAHERGLPATANWITSWVDGDAPANVWLGATVVNQAEADRDIPKLLQVPARVRFLSIEPMLGQVDLREIPVSGSGNSEFDPIILANVLKRAEAWPPLPHINWVICGGESGPGARPMHPDWARSLRNQCAAAGVPFLFKQWGEWAPYDRGAVASEALVAPRALDEPLQRFGKKASGRLLDGVEHNGFPA